MSRIEDQREELFNALTHGLGVVLSVGAGAVLITLAAVHAGAREIVSASVFVASLILLYTASTLYHLVGHPVWKARLKVLDHCAIFGLIAGTYTPFTIAVLKGGWGWSLFGVIWGLAVVGVIFKVFFTGRFRVLSTATYVGMGWLVVVALAPLSRVLTITAMSWLLLGGVLYTAGTLFYHSHRMRFAHAVWHLFVLAGSICHFVAVTAQMIASPA